MGFFGKGKEKRVNLDFRAVNRMERENFFHLLRQQGWSEMENSFEFDKNWEVDRIRRAAKAYAQKLGAGLLVEIEDPAFSSNPYNDLVYYVFKKGVQAQASPTANQSQQPNQSWFRQQQATKPVQTQNPQYPAYHQRTAATSWNAQNYPQTAADPRSQMSRTQSAGPRIDPSAASTIAPANAKPTELFLRSTYPSYSEAFVDCMSNISKMLCMKPCPLPFVDNKEYIGKNVVLARGGYNHMGVRKMDIVIVNPETDVYNMYGDEGHDPSLRRVQYMRDHLAIIKTEGLPRFDTLPDYDKLEEIQKGDIAKSLYMFLEQYLPKI